jgi:hypothetical protein
MKSKRPKPEKMLHNFGHRLQNSTSSDVGDSDQSKRTRTFSQSSATGMASSQPSSASSKRKTERGQEEKDKENRLVTKLNVSGWASAMTSLGKQKFAELGEKDGGNDGDDRESMVSRKHSDGMSDKASRGRFVSLSRESSRSRKSVPPSETKKIVRALQDFSGSSSELSFKAEDEIVVLDEVAEGLWKGELDGRQGLFPASLVMTVDEVKERSASASADVSVRRSVDEDDAGERPGNSPDSFDSEEDPLFGLLAVHLPEVVEEADAQKEQKPIPAVPPATEVRLDHERTTSLSGWSTSVPALNIPAKRVPPPPPPPRRSTGNLTSATVSAPGNLDAPPRRLPVPPGERGQKSPFDDSASGSAGSSSAYSLEVKQNPFTS